MLAVEVLGNFRLVLRGTPLPLPRSPRLRSLLAYLVLHPGTAHPRDYLAALLWPDVPESRARANLRKLVLALRRTLPHPERFLLIDAATVYWRTDVPAVVDAVEFERAARTAATPAAMAGALDLYRGELCPGCYDDWILAERERLRQVAVDLTVRLVAVLEARRDYTLALRHAQRLIAEDPLQESSYRLVMRLHALAGDRAGVARTYRACVDALQRELGVEPAPTTRDLYERLVRADTPRVPWTPSEWPLAGRIDEWAALLAAWEEADRGRPHVVLVTGEAGIGKTRLVEAAAEWAAAQGIAVAAARCFPAERPPAFAPMAALVRSRPLPRLDPVWIAELARLLPELESHLPRTRPTASPRTGDGLPWQRQRLFEALARALLAEQPLIIAIDDAHWCDRDSLDALDYLLRRDRRARLLLLVAYRPEDVPATHPLHACVAAWRSLGPVAELELRPLDAEATAELAGHVAGRALDPDTVRRLYQESEGNPLFVVELVRAGLGGQEPPREPAAGALPPGALPTGALPPRIRDVLWARLNRLSPLARRLVEGAVILGRPFTAPLLARVVGVDEATVLAGLEEVWQRRLVRGYGGGAYELTHDCLREVVSHALPLPRRQAIHRQVAAALAAGTPPEDQGLAEEIAVHYERAGLPDRAAPWYLQAADAAHRVYAGAQAADYLQRALAHARGPQRVEALWKLGETWRALGRWREAEAVLRDAVRLAASSPDPGTLARCQAALGALLVFRGFYAEGAGFLEDARRIFGSLPDAAGVADASLHLGIACWYRGDYPRALAYYEEALRLARALEDPRRACEAIGHQGLVHYDRKDYARALACFQEQLRIARALDYWPAVVRATNNLGIVHEELGEYAAAAACYVEEARVADDIGDRRSLAVAASNMSVVYRDVGDTPRSLRAAHRALEIALEVGDRWLAVLAVSNVAAAFAAEGRGQAAAPLLDAVVRLGRMLHVPYHLCKFLHWRARLAADAGDVDRARAYNAEALELAQRIGRPDIGFQARLLAAVLDVRTVPTGPDPEDLRRLDALGAEASTDLERAAVCWERWCLDGCPRAQEEAARLYHQVASRSGHALARRRYATLTGQRLPDPQPLPDLPASLGPPATALESALAQVIALERSGNGPGGMLEDDGLPAGAPPGVHRPGVA
jgi:DNA-binding SARP family transcriptional activator/tetratricopeptide (TPR) repeat protein